MIFYFLYLFPMDIATHDTWHTTAPPPPKQKTKQKNNKTNRNPNRKYYWFVTH